MFEPTPTPVVRVTDRLEIEDSTFNFRVSAQLKKEFVKLCRDEHLSAATALKRYMSQCLSKGRITK